MGKRGEPTTPDNPADGLVWTSVRDHHDDVGYEDDYLSVDELDREDLGKHPWALKGGGANKLKAALEESADRVLGDVIADIGRSTHTGLDPAFYVCAQYASRVAGAASVPLVRGEMVRDWALTLGEQALFPYDQDTAEPASPTTQTGRLHYWRLRTLLRSRVDFGKTLAERGMQ